MKFLDKLFGKKQPQQRGFRELIGQIGGINSDWSLVPNNDDMDIWTNSYALTNRVRDLARSNPIFQAYRETLWANVFGSQGILLRMQVKETEDRVVNSPEERACIEQFERRENRVREFIATKTGQEFKARALLTIRGTNGSRVATVKVGERDLFADLLIERKWKEWQRAEFCDVRGVRNYQTIRQLRLWSAVRDGDFFIRLVRGPRVNKFGLSLQLINAEWCDRFYNEILQNGNVIRMGVEYDFSNGGLGKVTAYHMIKRQPNDWQWSVGGLFGYGSERAAKLHDRIPAEEMIHYCRAVDAESTRPAPWVASTIPKARQLDQAMIAEVVAWRAAACKTGWLYSDIVPEGGYAGAAIDPATGIPSQPLGPGDIAALPYGVKFQPHDPTHPNANVEEFRKAAMRDLCAGMPGANYSTMANDYEAINFSAGRLQRLDSNELFMLLQEFDIAYAENKIFEAWLEMALITGAIPLPPVKFEKFNRKTFSGRRWSGVDEVKEVDAAAMRIANKLSSRTLENEAKSQDFEEICFQLAEEEMLMETFGLKTETTVETPTAEPAEEEEPEEEKPPAKPAARKPAAPKKEKLRI